MTELLKYWPAILSLVSFLCTTAFGGYLLYGSLWVKKEIKEPIGDLKDDLESIKATLEGTKGKYDIELTNLWRSKVDTTVFESKIGGIEKKQEAYQDKLVDFLLKQKVE